MTFAGQGAMKGTWITSFRAAVLVRLFGAFALALGLPSAASGQVMWQNVERGMSLEQVRSAQPKAVAVDKPENLHDGATCELHLSDYQVGLSKYEVCFYFLRGRLSQVTLGHIGKPEKSNFDEVVLLLTAKYGKPISVEQDVLGWSAEWVLPNGVNISVLYIGPKLTPLININFQYRIKTESDKL